MRPIGSNEILQVLLSLFLLYVVSAMFVAEAWVIYRLAIGGGLLPDSPLVSRRPAPWGIWTVLLTLVLYVVVHDGCVEAYGRITGRRLIRPARPGSCRRAGVAGCGPRCWSGAQGRSDRGEGEGAD